MTHLKLQKLQKGAIIQQHIDTYVIFAVLDVFFTFIGALLTGHIRNSYKLYRKTAHSLSKVV